MRFLSSDLQSTYSSKDFGPKTARDRKPGVLGPSGKRLGYEKHGGRMAAARFGWRGARGSCLVGVRDQNPSSLTLELSTLILSTKPQAYETQSTLNC